MVSVQNSVFGHVMYCYYHCFHFKTQPVCCVLCSYPVKKLLLYYSVHSHPSAVTCDQAAQHTFTLSLS